MKQIAWYHVRGGSGSFAAGVETLKNSCENASRAIETAIREWSDKIVLQNVPHDAMGFVAQDWDEELKLGLVLHLQVSQGQNGGGKRKCKISTGKMEYTTGSGLTFGWSRFDMDPGYSFFIIHPSGLFPEGSVLGASLRSKGWLIARPEN